MLQTSSVQGIDFESSHAALSASLAAGQPFARTLSGLRQGSVHDLHQFMIADWKRRKHNSGYCSLGQPTGGRRVDISMWNFGLYIVELALAGNAAAAQATG
jgi:hypothetical protein